MLLPGLAATVLIAVTPASPGQAAADAPLSPSTEGRIDAAVSEVLAADDTPSASIAVVLHGRIVYAKAFGVASLSPREVATEDTRYQLASASKSITAQTLLRLAADGRLSLDASVATWLPQVTDAAQLTVRELLEHVSGLPDHYPQTYPAGLRGQPTTPAKIIAEWGRHPLLFAPGTQFRYSNLNYVIAGRIAELASGEALFTLQKRLIFKPLDMTSVIDLDKVTPTTPEVATGYVRTGLGPLEPAPAEGPGWSFGAGQIVATATDLARWDIGLLSNKLLPAQGVREETTAPMLVDHSRSPYALGLFVSDKSNRRVWSHIGQGLGFLAGNAIYPDEKAAIVVLTNTSATSSFARIIDRIAFLVLAPTPADARASALIAALQNGRLDGANLTPEFAAYLTPSRLSIYRSSLGPLGRLTSLVLSGEDTADGVTTRRYEATAGQRRLSIIWEELANGQTDDFNIQPTAG